MSHTANFPALVLNADFRPVSVFPLSTWSFEKTLNKFLKGRVTVVEEYDVELRSPNLTYRPPSVIALKNYVQVPEKVPFNRMNILLRDNFQCQYCGTSLTLQTLTFDHVTPRAAGGLSRFDNIVSSCVACNTRKADKTDMKPMRTPYMPSGRELVKRRPLVKANLHATWLDYLYWSGVLEQD